MGCPYRGVSPHLCIPPFSLSCREQVCQVPHDLSQMLLLVPGEVHQIPQQECLHHGEEAWDPEPAHHLLLGTRNRHSQPVGLTPPSSLQIAIYGTNFCTSARNAFFLLMRNIIRSGKARPSGCLPPPPVPEPVFMPAPHCPLQSGRPRQSYRLPFPVGQASDRG